MYGHGLFETIKVIGGRLAFFKEHIERLGRGAADLRLSFPLPPSGLGVRCAAVIAASGLSDGSLKIVLFRDTEGVGELIATKENVYPPDLYARGYSLKTIPDGRRAGKVSGLKTLNTLKAVAARHEAQAQGFDEALFISSEGEILEGAISNLFIIRKGAVCTPALDVGILPGIVRSVVLRLLDGRDVRETQLSAAELATASEAFVTNSLLGVMPVARVDEQAFDVGKNPVTTALMAAYRMAEMESTSFL